MDHHIEKLNRDFEAFQAKIAELRRKQIHAVDAFGKRVAEKKIAEVRARIMGYGTDTKKNTGNQ